MFHFVTKVIGKIWSEEDSALAQQQLAASKPNPSASAATEKLEDGKNEKRVIGQVTSVHNGYGLIDHEIFFSFKLFTNSEIPKVGDSVEVYAQRKHEVGGWNATQVVSYSKATHNVWDDSPRGDDDQGQGASIVSDAKESLISQVTGLKDNVGYLSNHMMFELDVVATGYCPAKGDWVSVEANLDPDSGTRHVDSVKPLREKTFEGEIRSVHGGFGYIDDDLYFTLASCGDYVPHRTDAVSGRAIESSRGRSSWRAIEVNLKRSNMDLQRSFSLNQTSPSQTKSLSELMKNKEGIKITETIDLGDMKLNDVAATKVFIRNGGDKVHTLRSSRICDAGHGQFSIDDINYVPPNKEIDPNSAFMTPPGKSLVVTLVCKASNLGRDQQLIVFDFGDFKIGRYIKVTVHDHSFKSILEPSAPYQRKNRTNQNHLGVDDCIKSDSWVIPGQRPQRKWNIKLPNKLREYPIPLGLEEIYCERGTLELRLPELREALDMNNYSVRFSALLHLEEIQENINIRQFDIERANMRSYGEFLALKVDGLSEGRPSVLVGDRVMADAPGAYSSEPTHEGFVHKVLNEEILLKFHPEFHQSYREQDYNFRFVLNRTQLRRCHQAAHFALSLGPEVLFPSNLIPKIPQASRTSGKSQKPSFSAKTDAEHFINPILNQRQKSAVRRILSGQSRPTPYIIFGPPGTGKTITLVEALLQVHLNVPSSRIIACTPSNSAADLITTRLHLSGMVKPNDLVRLNSYSRAEQDISPLIEEYCKTGDDLELVSRHRILVCTCSSAGMMYALGLKPGHFTHVFIDEAGQATEPECMIPIGLVAGTDGQVVLAGDPQQLGPVLQNKAADWYGLGLSYLERLILLPIYARDESKFADHGSYDPLLVTKLVQNYRSHAALIKLPSLLFYHDELEVSAEPATTNTFLSWEKLPNPSVPIIFHGIRGQDMREGSSPSWFNPMEVIQVMRYLQCLVEDNTLNITMEDIGIIAPYRKQVEKIRLLVDKLEMDKVKVGSVEEFQGQERPVMIMSTVRSTEQHVESDIKHNLGFLKNPKRFNVSISRAQALMIIIGNPHVLSQDPYWRVLIQFCLYHKSVIGSDFPDLPSPDQINFDVPVVEDTKSAPATVQRSCRKAEMTKVDVVDRTKNASSDFTVPVVTKDINHSSDSKDLQIPGPPTGGGSSESEGDDETLSAHSIDTDQTDSAAETVSTGANFQASAPPPPPPAQLTATTVAASASTVPLLPKVAKSFLQGQTSHVVINEDILVSNSVHVDKCTTETNGAVINNGRYDGIGIHSSPSPDGSSSLSADRTNNTSTSLTPNRRLSPQSALTPGRSPRSSGKRSSIADRLVKSLQEHKVHEKTVTKCLDFSRADLHSCSVVEEKLRGEPSGQASVVYEEPGSKIPMENQGLVDSDVSVIPEHNTDNSTLPIEVHRGKEIANSHREHEENLNPPTGKNSIVTGTQNNVDQRLSLSEPQRENTSTFNSEAQGKLCNDVAAVDINDNSDSQKEPQKKSHNSHSNEQSYHPAMSLQMREPPTNLEKNIIRQIEFYFGDVNLYRDVFMQKQILLDSGWVPFSVLATFNRLRALTTDFEKIGRALCKSTSGLLEVDTQEAKVRRAVDRPVPSDSNAWLNSLKNRSLFVIGLKFEAQKEVIENFFEQWGDVEHVHILRPSRKPNGVTYPFVIVFRSALVANRLQAAASRGLRFNQSLIFIHSRENITDMLFQKPNQPRKPKNLAHQEPNSTKLNTPPGHAQGPARLGLLGNAPSRGPHGDGLLPDPPCHGLHSPPGYKLQHTLNHGQFQSPHIGHIGRGRGLKPATSTPMRSVGKEQPQVDPNPLSAKPVQADKDGGNRLGSPDTHVSDSSLYDSCLDQNDSDVVIESSDEEELPDHSG